MEPTNLKIATAARKANEKESSEEKTTPAIDYNYCFGIEIGVKSKEKKSKTTSTRQKNAIVLQNIGQGAVFIFCAYGVYKLPDVLFSHFGWPIEIAHIISFILFCVSVLWIFDSIPSPKYKYQKRQREIYARIAEIRAKTIEQAVWDYDISPLLKICDPEFIKHAETNSIFWKGKRRYSKED